MPNACNDRWPVVPTVFCQRTAATAHSTVPKTVQNSVSKAHLSTSNRGNSSVLSAGSWEKQNYN